MGLGLIVVIVALVALSIAVYKKAFRDFVLVTLKSESIGNQLLIRSDVKLRGLIVGSVREIDAMTYGAKLTLRIEPEQAELIPTNVAARIVPKTLFGTRYVELKLPENPADTHISDGDVIPKSRTGSTTEFSTALNNLLPVLRAVEPQKLSVTLTAISNALNGRGKQLGETLTELGDYLGKLNPHVPELEHNLEELAKFADNLNQAAPEAIDALDNLVTTAQTVLDKKRGLRRLYGTLTMAAQNTREFLAANKQNLVRLGATARPITELLAKYAPEYPCVLDQMAKLVPKVDKLLGKGTGKPGLKATIEITVPRGPYEPGADEPRFNDERGPRCYKLSEYPQPFPQQPPDGPLKDGSEPPATSRSVSGGLVPPYTGAKSGGYAGGGSSPAGGTNGVAYSAAEHNFLSRLIAPQVGMSAEDVPGWNSLLVAPLYRGAEVHLK